MIISTVKSIMQQEKIDSVERIVLEIGELSGVVPSYLEACYPAAVKNTFMQNTELKVEVVPGIARCCACNHEFNAYEYDFKCPVCLCKRLEAISGKEFMIKEILVCDKEKT